ncbi:MAG: hypothetical protein CMP65_01290 [Flavobacteriales bacterium]|nr:hypothetical protein [Flavobacteriales bacterium]|tara:strand:+ start:2320 stop:3531 length:1212 start_codon:yes stop_codon:yes gene_type:complete
MQLQDLQKKINKITQSSIWHRIFYWNNIILIIGELKAVIDNLFVNNETMVNERASFNEQIQKLDTDFRTEKKIKEKLENEIEILKNRIDLLLPLKTKNVELTSELNKLKQEENTKDSERDAVISKYEQFENNAREREAKKEREEILRAEEKQEKLKRTWQDHEMNVNKQIKFICQEESIKFIEDWPHDKKPDNVIQICNEFIVFDAKSPRNDDLDNFPNYIKNQVSALSKYADHKDVKKHLFLVVPENAINVLSMLTFNDSNYCVHIISPQALGITMWSLKQIELYEFAEKLSPEDRENLARAVAGSMNYIKRIIQMNSDMNDTGIQLTEQIMNLISKDSLKSIKNKALDYEKGDIINASQQKRGKIIDMEKEELRHKDLKFKAQNHKIISTKSENHNQIDNN